MSIHNKESVQEYIATITSDPLGINPPSVTVHRNTLGTITWARINVGQLQVISDGLFKTNYTSVLLTPGYDRPIQLRVHFINESNIGVSGWGEDDNPDDTSFQQNTIEIKVYNQLNQ